MSEQYLKTAPAATSIPEFDRLAQKVMVQGLLYGIAHIQSLPSERQELGSMFEMCALVRKITDAQDVRSFAYTLWGVEHHIGSEIDVWPRPHPGGSCTDEEVERGALVRGVIDFFADRFAKSGALIDAPPSDVVRFYDGLAA